MAISVLYLWEWPVLHILKLLVNGHNQSMTHIWSTFDCSKLLWWRISAALSHRKEAAVGISRGGSSQTRGSRLLKVTPSDYLTNELWPPPRQVLQFWAWFWSKVVLVENILMKNLDFSVMKNYIYYIDWFIHFGNLKLHLFKASICTIFMISSLLISTN